MPIKLLKCVLFAIFVSALVSAQPMSGPASFDSDWNRILSLGQTAVVSAASEKSAATISPGTAASLAAVQTRANSYRALAAAAKEFYNRYPQNSNGIAARKIEALAGLQGITDDDIAYEQTAMATASSFRNDRTNPVGDRFEVAHAVEARQVSKKLKGKSWISSPIEAEAMADRLHLEFGDIPHAHAMILSVAEATTCDNARDLAVKLLQSPAVAPEMREAAQRVYDRVSLMGKTLDFPLVTSDGRAVRLRQLEGTHTVVYVWSADRDAKGPSGLQPVKNNVPAGTQWVYVALGNYVPTAAATRARGIPPGIYCNEISGLKSPVVEQLKITQLPCAFVFDANGVLTGFGKPGELPRLLARPFDPARLP